MSVSKHIKSLIAFTTENLPSTCNYIDSVPDNEKSNPRLCTDIFCSNCLMNSLLENKTSVIKILEKSNE